MGSTSSPPFACRWAPDRTPARRHGPPVRSGSPAPGSVVSCPFDQASAAGWTLVPRAQPAAPSRTTPAPYRPSTSRSERPATVSNIEEPAAEARRLCATASNIEEPAAEARRLHATASYIEEPAAEAQNLRATVTSRSPPPRLATSTPLSPTSRSPPPGLAISTPPSPTLRSRPPRLAVSTPPGSDIEEPAAPPEWPRAGREERATVSRLRSSSSRRPAAQRRTGDDASHGVTVHRAGDAGRRPSAGNGGRRSRPPCRSLGDDPHPRPAARRLRQVALRASTARCEAPRRPPRRPALTAAARCAPARRSCPNRHSVRPARSPSCPTAHCPGRSSTRTPPGRPATGSPRYRC